MRLKARELFDAVDDDRSGFLDKEEAQELATKIRKKCKVELVSFGLANTVKVLVNTRRPLGFHARSLVVASYLFGSY